ncbi:MAG: AraC family transcriptional regulator [bacterium]
MVQGREPIGIIAQDAGFASPAHFAFQFKQRFGLTPRAYRQAGQTRSLPQPIRTSA